MQPPVGWLRVPAAEADRATASEVGPSPSSEVRVRSQRGVGLYEGDTMAPGVAEGAATLTSWCIYFRCSTGDGDSSIDLKLPLDAVVDAKSYAGVKFFSSPKIVLALSGTPRGRPSFTKISFRQGGHTEFLSDLRVMLEKRRWVAAAAAAVPPTPQPPAAGGHLASGGSRVDAPPAAPANRGAPNSAPADRRVESQVPSYASTTTTASAGHATGMTVTERAGIRGLVDKRDAHYESQQSALRSATTDLDELLRNAPKVQAIVRALKSGGGSASRADGSGGEGDGLEVRHGIAAPVTREAAGKDATAWQTELASELCLWLLRHPSLRARPVVALAELFALYNRGRGAMHALPPTDVLAACTGLEHGSLTAQARAAAEKAHAAWLLETDESGVVQLRQSHAKYHALEVVAALLAAGLPRATSSAGRPQLLATAEEALPVFRQGVRAAELAAKMRLSVDEALELLEALEDDGVLARGAPRGLNAATQRPLFYWNPFTAPGAMG